MRPEALPAGAEVEPQSLEDGELVEQLAALIRAYVARLQARPPAAPLAQWTDRLTATESVLFAVELLRAAEVTSFELAAMFNV